MIDIIMDTVFDTIKTVPFLLILYVFFEYAEQKTGNFSSFHKRNLSFGPLLGGLFGCIPQCGFSAAAAILYHQKMIQAGTLIAVFLSTSDEAIPILLSASFSFESWKRVGVLLLSKLIIGVLFGYFLNTTVFRKEQFEKKKFSIADRRCCCCPPSSTSKKFSFLVRSVLMRTLQITIYLFLTMLLINIGVGFLGEERFSALLLSGNLFQPFLTAFLGLIPGCSISILITNLWVNESLSFGSALSGLCSGAGFGFVILFRMIEKRKFFILIFWLYLISAVSGLVVNMIFLS